MILMVFSNPNYAMILSICWTMGKTGRATPLAIPLPVLLCQKAETCSFLHLCHCPLLYSSNWASLALPGHLHLGTVSSLPSLSVLIPAKLHQGATTYNSWLLAHELPRSWLGVAHASEGFMQYYALSSTTTQRIPARESRSSQTVQQAAENTQCWAADRHTPGSHRHWQVHILVRRTKT